MTHHCNLLLMVPKTSCLFFCFFFNVPAEIPKLKIIKHASSKYLSDEDCDEETQIFLPGSSGYIIDCHGGHEGTADS